MSSENDYFQERGVETENLTGFYWNLLESAGNHWNLLESTGNYRNLQEIKGKGISHIPRHLKASVRPRLLYGRFKIQRKELGLDF